MDDFEPPPLFTFCQRVGVDRTQEKTQVTERLRKECVFSMKQEPKTTRTKTNFPKDRPVSEKTTAKSYVRPRIVTHSSKDLENQSLQVNACTSFIP